MKKFFEKLGLLQLFIVATALVACGGDSGNSSDSAKINAELGEVETIYDLEDCDESRNGEVAYVSGDQLYYLCKDSAWQNLDSLAALETRVDTVTVKDVDTVTVQNVDTVTVQNVDTLIIKVPAVDSSNIQDTLPPEEIVEIEKITLEGESQKGPFIKNTSVTAYELKDGRTLKQTGKTFKGLITSDNGRYKIPSVVLASQYAYISVNGSYRNEVTGKNSDKSISMQAIVDLSSRQTANINVMTHIEYERVFNLVTKQGMRVRDAKKKAENEIFKAFHMNVPSYANSEDLNIFGESDGSAALLAISVILQGDRDTDDFGELLSDLSVDIADDGLWNGPYSNRIRAELARWVATKDTSDLLPEIRTNVEKWNLGNVPAFEKYLREFWNAEFGFGECGSDSILLGTKLEVSNKYAQQKDAQNRFVCYDDDGTSRWVLDIDAVNDVYGARFKCTAETDGNLMKGLVNPENIYACNYKAGGWKLAEDDVTQTLGGCFERVALMDTVGLVGETYYKCRQTGWELVTPLEYDTYKYLCKNGVTFAGDKAYAAGQVFPGRIDKPNKYVCDADTFRVVPSSEEILIVDEVEYACVSSLENEFYYGFDEASSVVKCEKGNWNRNFIRDSRDGQFYRITTIGGQTWMAENLKYRPERKYDFDEYKEGEDGLIYKFGWVEGAHLCGNYYSDYCTPVADDWNACPGGWHLPSDVEWSDLIETPANDAYLNYKIDVSDRTRYNYDCLTSGQGCFDSYSFNLVSGRYYVILSPNNQDGYLVFSDNLDYGIDFYGGSGMTESYAFIEEGYVRCVKNP